MIICDYLMQISIEYLVIIRNFFDTTYGGFFYAAGRRIN